MHTSAIKPLAAGFSPDWNGGGAVAERSGAMEAKAGTVESGFKNQLFFMTADVPAQKKCAPLKKKGTHDFLPEKAVFYKKFRLSSKSARERGPRLQW